MRSYILFVLAFMMVGGLLAQTDKEVRRLDTRPPKKIAYYGGVEAIVGTLSIPHFKQADDNSRFNPVKGGSGFNVNGGIRFGSRWDLGLYIAHKWKSLDNNLSNNSYTYDNREWQFYLQGSYKVWPNIVDQLDLHLFLGGGYTSSATDYIKNGQEQEEGEHPIYPKNLIFVPFGFGLEYTVDRNISIIANAKGSYYTTPKEIIVYNELIGGLKAIHDYDWSTHSIDIGIRYYFE